MSLELWLGFALASAIAVAIPGPVVIFVLGRAAAGGCALASIRTSSARASRWWVLISSRLACKSASWSSTCARWRANTSRNFCNCAPVSRGLSYVSMMSLASVRLKPRRLARKVSFKRVRSRAL
jgi:hypothetical protein